MFFYVIAVGLIGGSFQKLSPSHIALEKDTINGQVTSDKVFFGGLYFLGLSKAFEPYPRKAIFMELLDISATSQDGNSIQVDVSVEYQLNPDELFALYSKHGTSYESYYESQVREVVQQESLKWDTQPDFYVERKAIARGMRNSLVQVFNSSQATLVGFQLRKVDLPDSLEDAILNTLIAEQFTTTAEVEQEATLTRTEASVVESEAEAEIQEIYAEAEAEGTLLRASATAQATFAVSQARGDALVYLSNKLNLTKTELFSLLWQQTVPANPALSKANIGTRDTSDRKSVV